MICGAFCLAFGSLRASTNLHQAILKNCLRSPMSFYDTTPLGRIVNRFAKDIDVIDTIIPRNLDAWGKCTINVMATVIMISYATPLFMAVIFPLGIFYFFVQVPANCLGTPVLLTCVVWHCWPLCMPPVA